MAALVEPSLPEEIEEVEEEEVSFVASKNHCLPSFPVVIRLVSPSVLVFRLML